MKHTHRPAQPVVAGDHWCLFCGKTIRWVPEQPDRMGHWRRVRTNDSH